MEYTRQLPNINYLYQMEIELGLPIKFIYTFQQGKNAYRRCHLALESSLIPRLLPALCILIFYHASSSLPPNPKTTRKIGNLLLYCLPKFKIQSIRS